ncbi:MAG: hypothetical protein WHT06_01920 [Desulfobacterales bacterium]
MKWIRWVYVRRGFALAAALVGVACAATAPPPSPPGAPAGEAIAGAFPADYESRILTWLRVHEADPDSVEILSIAPPQLRVLEQDLPEQGLAKGDAVWESVLVTRKKASAGPPRSSRILFREGVIRAVLR